LKNFNMMVIIALVICSPMISLSYYDCEPDQLEVLFHSDFQMRMRQNIIVSQSQALSPEIKQYFDSLGSISWEPLGSLVTEDQLDYYHQQAEKNLNRPVYNMNNIYYLHLTEGQNVWEVAAQLKAFPEILNAYPIPKPMPLPTPNWEDEQKYLNNKSDWPPTGLSAKFASKKIGGSGTGVTICDFEYSWNTNHVDLTKSLYSQLNPYAQDPFNNTDHGTAVLGELIADNNGWGVTGIAYGSDIITYGTYFDPSPPHTNPQWHVAEAITEALLYLKPGDVMLFEQQWEYTSGVKDFVPIEWWGSYSPSGQGYNAVYAGIETAIGNGIHVVEAGGNGSVDLNSLSWYGDSGAIIVGAGGAYTGSGAGDLAPMSFSSFGDRVDVQGWGEDVQTTGYGTCTGYTGDNDKFCWDFAGTSSASPMVAASVACCIGYWTQNYYQDAASLNPLQIRSLLINTGTPQDPFTNKHIGPRPDLEEAFKLLDAWAPATLLQVDLVMPATYFTAGDQFFLEAQILNPGPYSGYTPLVIILDVMGNFYFYPTWTTSFNSINYELKHGTYILTAIPLFNWPSGTGSLNNINVYGALLSTDFSSILGIYDKETFGFSS